jgi:hypothetical protein
MGFVMINPNQLKIPERGIPKIEDIFVIVLLFQEESLVTLITNSL